MTINRQLSKNIERCANRNCWMDFDSARCIDKDQLIEVSGTTDLENITSLKICIDMNEVSIDGLGKMLPKLSLLDMAGSIITSFREFGVHLRNLHSVTLSYSKVTHLDGISVLSGLREIYLQQNDIDDLTPLALHENIQIIDLKDNKLVSLSCIEVLGTCESLQSLDLRGNSISTALSQFQCNGINGRSIICHHIPTLKILDGVRVKNVKQKLISDNIIEEASLEIDKFMKISNDTYLVSHVKNVDEMMNINIIGWDSNLTQGTGIFTGSPMSSLRKHRKRPSGNLEVGTETVLGTLDRARNMEVARCSKLANAREEADLEIQHWKNDLIEKFDNISITELKLPTRKYDLTSETSILSPKHYSSSRYQRPETSDNRSPCISPKTQKLNKHDLEEIISPLLSCSKLSYKSREYADRPNSTWQYTSRFGSRLNGASIDITAQRRSRQVDGWIQAENLDGNGVEYDDLNVESTENTDIDEDTVARATIKQQAANIVSLNLSIHLPCVSKLEQENITSDTIICAASIKKHNSTENLTSYTIRSPDENSDSRSVLESNCSKTYKSKHGIVQNGKITGQKSKEMFAELKKFTPGPAVHMADTDLVTLLQRPPRGVPELRTHRSFREFFSGMSVDRMNGLLKVAYSGSLEPDAAERKVQKRLELVKDILI